ncbi:hypothetical protein [Jannaschia ovalis]|uniref:Uncharacterized protein n=1 Tax=Jannaschia ovalis TaxID=3038773 RepID=A0ABY8LFQ0_9RHOB|nr:hypothetical protein [Jannaschia sp. GRR-S6-38]WGH78935.1 hypothetical protein P8627_01345 [Jannaschia sp. GRR-S6-38]
MIRALPVLVLLTACAPELPRPEGTISATALAQTLPQLVPLDPLLARAAIPSRAEAAQAALARRAALLRARGVAPPPASDLDARGAALRARAEALRAVEI